MEADDKASVWSCENGPPESFSTERLCEAVQTFFGVRCKLVKMAQGGYHKVYDILAIDDESHAEKTVGAVVRVASPAFPGDKMKSEIATLKYIASHSSIPVPAVLAWSVDASNPVGAEYMIMRKIPGVTADDVWPTLSADIKEKVVIQVAEHLAALFSLRFEKAGSLYCAEFPPESLSPQLPEISGDTAFEVGPVVSGPFYRMMDGILDYPTTDLHAHVNSSPSSLSAKRLHSLRGPFTTTSDYLAHYLRALLFKITEFPNETMEDIEVVADGEIVPDGESKIGESPQKEKEKILHDAERVLQKAIKLCHIYPGEAAVYPADAAPAKHGPFTIRMEDFRLVNILIESNTGMVNGFIDFEAATTAPLWVAATVPDWIPDPDSDMASWYGGTPEDQRRLWNAFHATMDGLSPEWRNANRGGKLFHRLVAHLELGVSVWASNDREEWVDERLEWASKKENTGIPMPEDDI